MSRRARRRHYYRRHVSGWELAFSPFILFGRLMWLLVKWGGIGLFLLTAASCKQLAKLTRVAFAAWQRHRALAHP